MSFAIKIDEINPIKAKQISKYLTVTQPKEKHHGGGPISFYKQEKSIEAYTMSEDHKTIYLPFSYVYQHFPSLFMFNEDQPELSPLNFEGTLLDRQISIKKETFDILNRTHSILLSLHTGFGKTIYTIYLLNKIKKHTIILCHRKIIIEQWLSAIQKYLPNADVAVWTPKMKIQPEILIINTLSISKWDRERYSQYGLVVIDEIHTMCTDQMIKGLPLLQPQYVIGLSATPFRSDGMDRLIELYVGPEMIIRNMKRMFNVYKVNTKFKPFVGRHQDGTIDWNSVLESQALSESRNELIVNLTKLFIQRTILILVKRVDHANILKNMIKEEGEDVDVFLGSSKEANYNCRILICTYSKGGVGFDHPKLDMLIMGGDVEENFTQYMGRVFRKDITTPIILDLVDNNSIMKRHSTTRSNICKEAGGTILKFEKSWPYF
jgi:superfamily II DNA or RNA helicase